MTIIDDKYNYTISKIGVMTFSQINNKRCTIKSIVEPEYDERGKY